ncbi:APC family permease [Subtercola frigoramans]|uniref:Amino acid transporter n=1 Tax=Subtercola frigoramans TaxID=120298 RepID=A0ABS2L122_9MICO|nr:APC family permease [Subtercola frigoramans]MBM7470774.1 amino acid transporter [Subtercola frigoramans]
MTTSSQATASEADVEAHPGRLNTATIVFMVAAAASPLSILAGVVPLGFLFGNGIGLPVMFAVAGAVFILFSVGLVAMAARVTQSGGFFALISQGAGRVAGVAASYVALVAYWSLIVGISAYLGYVIEVTVAGNFGVDIPWWAFAVLALLGAGALGFQRIDTSSKVLSVLLIAELLVVIALTIAVVVSGGGEGLSLQPFAPSEIFSGSPAIGLVFAAQAFIGFEATVIYRREARNPSRTIPRATYLAVILVGLFYVISSWMLVMAWGPTKALDVAAADPGSMLLTTADRYLGSFGQVAVEVLLITSLFAAVLSFHNVLNRYQLSMAQAGVLPSQLATVHGRTGSPRHAAAVQTVISVGLIIVFALLGLDPVVQVFAWLPSIAALSVLSLMAVVSVSVVLYFRRQPGDVSLWKRVVAPVLSLIALVGMIVFVLIYFPLLTGEFDASGNPFYGPISLVLVGIIVLAAAGGIARALVMRARRPEQYTALASTLHE